MIADLKAAALQCGQQLTRMCFEKRKGSNKNQVEVHLTKNDLAILCATAFEIGVEAAQRVHREVSANAVTATLRLPWPIRRHADRHADSTAAHPVEVLTEHCIALGLLMVADVGHGWEQICLTETGRMMREAAQ